MHCTDCGKVLNIGSSFCFNCGKSIRKKERENSEIRENTKEKLNIFNHQKVFLIVLLVIFLLIYTVGRNAYDSYKSKQANAEAILQETKAQLQETRQQLEDVKNRVGAQESFQQNELSETKKELSSVENKNRELQSLINSQDNERKIQTSISTSDFINENGKYVVKIICFDSQGNSSLGSGVIIGKSDSATVIITNNHVIPKYLDRTLLYPCAVGFSNSPTVNISNLYYAEPVYYQDKADLNTMSIYDFNYLIVRSELNLEDYSIKESGPHLLTTGRPLVCKMEDIKVGKKVLILGYAAVGGTFLTAKEGILSGYDTIYASTSAKIEQGDSGGGAFLPESNCLIGMPTFSVSGKVESLGRVLMLSYIADKIISLAELNN